MVIGFRKNKSEDLQSTLDHRSMARSEPTKKSINQDKSGRKKVEDNKSRSRIIWVSVTRSSEGGKRKKRNQGLE